jgi:hypothetical protein
VYVVPVTKTLFMFENYLYLAVLVIKMNCKEDMETNRVTPLFFNFSEIVLSSNGGSLLYFVF